MLLFAKRPSPAHGLLSFSPPRLSYAPLLPCVCALSPLHVFSLLVHASAALSPAAFSSLVHVAVAVASREGDKVRTMDHM